MINVLNESEVYTKAPDAFQLRELIIVVLAVSKLIGQARKVQYHGVRACPTAIVTQPVCQSLRKATTLESRR